MQYIGMPDNCDHVTIELWRDTGIHCSKTVASEFTRFEKNDYSIWGILQVANVQCSFG